MNLPPLWLIVTAVAAVQWLFFASLSAIARESFPKTGMRRSDQLLIASSFLVAAAVLAQVDYRSLWKGTPKTSAASAVSTPKSSCATVATGMTVAEVKSRMGEPDATRPDEENRGPGAVMLVYAGSRCTVHAFGGVVELVD